jgi:hypothetical protein
MLNLYEPRMMNQPISGGRNILKGLNDLCLKYGLNKTHNVLELGSNDGVSTKLFANYCNTVYALDINFSDKLKQTVLENSNIKYVSGNLVDAINNFKDYFLDNLFTFSNICRWQNQLISQNLITSNKDKMFNFYRSLP